MTKLQPWSSFRSEASPYGTCRRRGGAHNGARGFAHLTLFHPWAQYCSSFSVPVLCLYFQLHFAHVTLFHPVHCCSSVPVPVFHCCTFSYILSRLHCSTHGPSTVPVFQCCACTFSFSILHCSTQYMCSSVPVPVFQFQCSSVPLCTFSYILHGLHCSISQTFDQGSHSIDFPILWAQTRVLLLLWRQQGVERE